MSDLRDDLGRVRRLVTPPGDAYERLLRRRDRKRRNGRLASAALGLVVAAAAITGAAVAFGHGHAGPGVNRTGPAAGPSLQAGPGQYYYWKTVRPMGEGGNVVEEIWWGEDGSGRYLVDSGNDAFGTPKSQSWGPGGPPADLGFPFESDLSGLSTDPSTLRQQLLDRSGETGPSPEPAVTLNPGLSPETSRMWRSIQNLLEQGDASAPLRAALFDVASGLDGVRVDNNAVDPVGRPAISVSVQLGDYYCGGADVVWFDPETHLMLAGDGDLGCSPSVIVVAGGIVGSTSDTVQPGDGYIPAPVTPLPATSPVPTTCDTAPPAPSPPPGADCAGPSPQPSDTAST